jgi:hypothetical protein
MPDKATIRTRPPFPGRKIIAFCGPKGCGKDAAAQCLFARASLNGPLPNLGSGCTQLEFFQINFADRLRKIVCQMFNIPLEALVDPLTKEVPHPALYGHTPRFVQQNVAQISRDIFSPTIWADRWKEHIDECSNANYIVCTDIRHPEELEVLRNYVHVLIYVVRPEVEAARKKGGGSWDHPSESHYEMLKATSHFQLINSGSLTDLYVQVDTVFNLWKEVGHVL